MVKPSKNYALLLFSQTLVYLGDAAVLVVILGPLTFRQKAGNITNQELMTQNAIYSCMLFVPFVLLAPMTGYLNDRFPKARWLLWGSFVKIVGALIGAIGLIFHHDWQAAAYFIIGIGAAVYSPAKYGILPEILPLHRLVKANGTIELLTLIAVLGGNLAGAAMIDHIDPILCYFMLAGIYGIALAATMAMTLMPGDATVRWQRSVPEFFSNFRQTMSMPRISKVLIGTTLFWLTCGVNKMNVQPWALDTLGLGTTTTQTNTAIAMIGVWLAVGVMFGSVLAGQLHRVGDLRSTRIYGGILGGFIATLALANHQTPYALAMLGIVTCGFFGGLFLIPLNAALQAETDHAKLGKTIATQNFLENLGMTAGSAAVLLGGMRGLTPPGIFIGLAVTVGLFMLYLRIPPQPDLRPVLVDPMAPEPKAP